MDSIDNKTQQDLDEADIKVTIEAVDTDSEEADVHIIGIESDPQSGVAAAYDYEDGGENVFIEIIDVNEDSLVDDGEPLEA